MVALPDVHLLVPSLIQVNCPYRVQTQEESVQPWESKQTAMALTAASEPVVSPSPCYLLVYITTCVAASTFFRWPLQMYMHT